MGYFSSGCEGLDYQERYCFGCAHWRGERGCPVWMLQFRQNSEAANVKHHILHEFIPFTEDGLGNEQCALYAKAGEVAQQVTSDVLDAPNTCDECGGPSERGGFPWVMCNGCMQEAIDQHARGECYSQTPFGVCPACSWEKETGDG